MLRNDGLSRTSGRADKHGAPGIDRANRLNLKRIELEILLFWDHEVRLRLTPTRVIEWLLTMLVIVLVGGAGGGEQEELRQPLRT